MEILKVETHLRCGGIFNDGISVLQILFRF